jgi:chromosome segregation protein
MYLKRLEIHGFKSFAARTVFEFGPGITCIIGPNGVGKSNVADAIRWVLGEQSGRTLRARRVEDIIFSGSSQRSAVGMADVSLVFDNSDGWLPIEFGEVVIGRRAYRDGQSEYLLNRNRVRLRDIQDLFVHAHLGQGGCTFMGQGLVEEVLSLRPEERRSLIEEAADVRRYRVKLDDARNRLAATRDNLERVNLLISEISPTLARLERQAERAATYSRLNHQLSQALRAWYGHLWREGQDTLTAALADHDQRQEEYRQAEAEIHTYQEGLQSLQKAIADRRREMSERTAAERELADEVRRLEHQCALDEERHRLLSERCQELRSDIEGVEAERQRQSQGAVGADDRQANLDQEMERCLAQLMAHRQELAHVEKERAELRREAVEAEEKAVRAQNALREIDARLERAQKAEEGFSLNVDEMKGRRREIVHRLASLAQDFRAYHEERQRIDRELTPLAGSQMALTRRIAEARAAITRSEESVPELQGQLERATARLDILGRVQSQHEGFDAAVRTLLIAGGRIPPGDETVYPQPNSLQGVLGIVARLVRVSAGLEKAIEAALAANLQAIVLESHSDALAVIELLNQYQNGRVTMYPMDSLKPSRPLVLLKEKGILGVASELVSCESRYRPLIETLLGRTIVVENLPMALKVVKRGLGSVVTLDGELFQPMGSITSGTSRSTGDLVARESELRSLPEEISQLQSSLSNLQAVIAGERETIKGCESELAAQEQRQQRLWQERAELEQSLVEYQGRLSLAGGQMRELRHEAARNEQGAKQYLAERKGLERERDTLVAEAEAAAEKARHDTEAVAALNERLPPLTEAVTEASIALAAVEGERQALVMRREEQEAALARIDSQIGRKSAQLADLEREIAALAVRLRDGKASFLKQQEQLAALTRVQGPGQEELTQLESRERSLKGELEAAQSRRLEAERGLLEAQAEVKLKTDEVNALQGNMEGEGFVPTETGDVVPVIATAPAEVPTWLAEELETAGEPETRLPPIQGGARIDPAALKEEIAQIRSQMRSLGPVDEQAPADYAERKQRYDFLTGQTDDLSQAEESLREAIIELEEKISSRFTAAFHQVNSQFEEYFTTFFGGGSARLLLTQAKDDEEPGVEIVAQPPGKRVSSLSVLSGGERSLTAISLLFALLQTRPSAFSVLDEVDAALDESNVGRFVEAVHKLSEKSQFIIITHNRRTIETSDHLYGVSMGRDSTSSVLSLRLSDVALKE